jgi:hypothetical protein
MENNKLKLENGKDYLFTSLNEGNILRFKNGELVKNSHLNIQNNELKTDNNGKIIYSDIIGDWIDCPEC